MEKIVSRAVMLSIFFAQGANAIYINEWKFLSLGGDLSNIQGSASQAFSSLISKSKDKMYDSVGLLESSSGYCTATWLGQDDGWVYLLTAAHCFYQGGSNISPSIKMSFYDYNNKLIASGSGFGYVPKEANNNTTSHMTRAATDIALIKLPKVADLLAADGTQPPSPIIYDGRGELDEINKHISFVGYGAWGVGKNGASFKPSGGRSERRLYVENLTSTFYEGGKVLVSYFNETVYRWGRWADGDSGGALWQKIKGHNVITSTVYGGAKDQTYGPRASNYIDWIRSIYKDARLLSYEFLPWNGHKGIGQSGDLLFRDSSISDKRELYRLVYTNPDGTYGDFPENEGENEYFKYIGPRKWDGADSKASIGDVYIYNNPYTKDLELMMLKGFGYDGKYGEFPADKTSNHYWQYLGKGQKEHYPPQPSDEIPPPVSDGGFCEGEDIRVSIDGNIYEPYFPNKDNTYSEVICAIPAISSDSKDISGELNSLIQQASLKYNGINPVVIYIPSGNYWIEHDIIPASGVRLVGSSQYGPSVISSRNGAKINGANSLEINNFQFEQLYLKNVSALFEGRNKTKIASVANVFYDIKSQHGILSINNTNAINIVGNVFLRGQSYPGMGLRSDASSNTVIKSNLFGNAIHLGQNEIWESQVPGEYSGKTIAAQWLSNPDDEITARHHTRLNTFYNEHVKGGHIFLELRKYPQGNFTTVWQSQNDMGVKFESNIIENDGERYAYNPTTGMYDLENQYLVNLMKHKNTNVSKNYFGSRGEGASFVVRNGSDFNFSLNHLSNIPLKHRNWEGSTQDRFNIHGNRFSGTASYEYYDSNIDTPLNGVVLADNLFEGKKESAIKNVSQQYIRCSTTKVINAAGIETDGSMGSNVVTHPLDGSYVYGSLPDQGRANSAISCSGKVTPIENNATSSIMSGAMGPISHPLRKEFIDKHFANLSSWKDFLTVR